MVSGVRCPEQTVLCVMPELRMPESEKQAGSAASIAQYT